MAKQTAAKPVGEVKIYPIRAAIWANEHDGRKFYNITLERTYKDDDGYKSSQSYGKDDLLTAAKVLDGAHSWIVRQEAKDHEAAQKGGN